MQQGSRRGICVRNTLEENKLEPGAIFFSCVKLWGMNGKRGTRYHPDPRFEAKDGGEVFVWLEGCEEEGEAVCARG